MPVKPVQSVKSFRPLRAARHPGLAAAGTWVAVADEGRARLFRTLADGALQELEDFIAPQRRLPAGHFLRDARPHLVAPASNPSGQGADRRSTGHSADRRTMLADKFQNQFAQHIAERLALALREGDYQHLVIVAAPRFLGHLRPFLSPAVTRCVCATLNKDLTRLPAPRSLARLNRLNSPTVRQQPDHV